MSSLRHQIYTQFILFRHLSVNPKFWLILAIDIFLLLLAHLLAYYIRFMDIAGLTNLFLFLPYTTVFSLPLLLICVKIPVFYLVGIYRGMWRYTSFSDIINILKGTIYSEAVVLIFLIFFNRLTGYSRTIFIIDALLTFLFISGHRAAIRFFYKNFSGTRQFFLNRDRDSVKKRRLLLVGAGSAADNAIRELQNNHDVPFIAVGLVDDDIRKTGLKIHGIPVVGLVEDIAQHIIRTKADEILITADQPNAEEMSRIVTLCQESGCPYKVLPSVNELIGRKESIRAIRDIKYSDLLGREEVHLEIESINSYLTDKVVLITGAGGSIGSELSKQILRFSPKQILLFDAGEENLFTIENRLHHELDFPNIVPILGKVQDSALLEDVFRRYKPAVVFHAAAYKHVPLVEQNPWQAVHNNIVASQLLIEAAICHSVERFVLVSTDKAVRPTNVMGASKRLTELLMLAYSKQTWDGSFSPARHRLYPEIPCQGSIKGHNTIFMAVRFGNVLGSSGSVVPLFTRQIQRGGPVTVTHKDVCRFFMSIEEAAQLILQAGAMGKGGEIFILRMGEPVRIDKLARDLIKLAGREPDTEIEIRYTGLRDGEKLKEELITEGEGIVSTDHSKIMVLRGDGKPGKELCSYIEELLEKSRQHDSRGIKEILQQIIPEYNADFSTKSTISDTTR